ncbi:MAG TPA: sialidase family protein [Candidatus Hydrogenedentes bacterium]|nr:exo-alpha-sialidase [Candidatus Hydrogenedentota bacterium]HPA05654.1 sialidase family protein [Candidatus Hydrogenedentota bacterium]HPV39144.1 sialidase family protein [Candidatus Hydrogenedentota bacterium]
MKQGAVLVLVLVLGVAAGAAEPDAPRRTLVLNPGEGNPRNSEGDFIQLNDGRILFVYTRFTGSASDHGAAFLAARVSTDAGETWSAEDTVILPNEGGMNVMSVSLLRLRAGEIALFYLRKNSTSDCRPMMRISKDEAATWSEPVLCIESVGYYVVNNDRVIQLDSGRLVIPAARHSLPGESFSGRGQAMCHLSDDGGATWYPSQSILDAPEDSKSGLQEPAVVPLKDGRLMMLCRTDQGCQMRSFSPDGGVTWTPAELTDIASPVSPATIERIPSTGDLLILWNDHRAIEPALKGKRTPFAAAISRDEGKTWENVRLLDTAPDGWYCYTALDFAGDAALLGYCAGDSAVGHLNRTQVVRVPIAWFYAN